MVKVLGEGIDCSICLSGFEISEEAKEMPCKHHFHSICIDKWLGINGLCLIYRYKMSVDEQCEKKDEESGGDERGDDGGSHMEEDGVKFIFHVIITPETTHLTVSITEVHRHFDDMLLEVGDCVVYEVGNGDVSEVGNGDESEAGNGDESQARNVSENGDGNESEARYGNVSEAQDGDSEEDD
ncbi:RING-H2 finger protein ATL3-like [Solanum tuberosum]|uniref:RING-type E3 ubiquitin transferase n=1 Tax=Solanum tuberosum TaxID=4113 RepID=M1BIK8_SOLTU|nr:PREDICTED: RING-H2 finger protein ATL3-like [Solanum tuberosum]